jgi:hypothetical protein
LSTNGLQFQTKEAEIRVGGGDAILGWDDIETDQVVVVVTRTTIADAAMILSMKCIAFIRGPTECDRQIGISDSGRLCVGRFKRCDGRHTMFDLGPSDVTQEHRRLGDRDGTDSRQHHIAPRMAAAVSRRSRRRRTARQPETAGVGPDSGMADRKCWPVLPILRRGKEPARSDTSLQQSRRRQLTAQGADQRLVSDAVIKNTHL